MEDVGARTLSSTVGGPVTHPAAAPRREATLCVKAAHRYEVVDIMSRLKIAGQDTISSGPAASA